MKMVLIGNLFLAWSAFGLAFSQGVTVKQESPPAGENLPAVKEILDRYFQVTGADTLPAIQTIKRSGTLIRGELGRISMEMVSTSSGRWYYNQVFAYGEQVSYICNNREAWVEDCHGSQPLPSTEYLDLQMLLEVHSAEKWAEIYPAMTVKSAGRREEKEIVTLEAKSRNGIVNELVFDRQSGLLLQAGDLFFEDYRAEGKRMLPHRIFLGPDPGKNGLRLKIDIAQVRLNEPVPDTLFERSKCPLPLLTPPLYRLRKQIQVAREAMLPLTGVYQHPSDAQVQYTVSLQDDHLMLGKTGWSKRVEIRPESDMDYFIRFQNQEIHFVWNSTGRILRMEIGPDRSLKAEKIR